MMRGAVYLLAFAIGTTTLSGCAPVVVGGAATGVSMVHDRRTSGVVLEDQNIELKGMKLLSDHPDIQDRSNISITSYNRIVVLTGQAETPRIKRRFADLASHIPEVRRVVDEVTVGPSSSVAAKSSDAYTTAKVKLALFDIDLPEFDPTRIKVVTERGNVYLMGLVTRKEAAAVVEKTRHVDGVAKVVKVFEYIPSAS